MLLAFFVYLCIFYGSLKFGQWSSGKTNFIASLGEKVYIQKIDQLNSSSFFGILRKAIKESSLSKTTLFIFPLIVFKSIAFYFISLVLITPFVLITQGIIMGSLFVYSDKQIENSLELRSITYWQLTSHIVAGSYGTFQGLDWFFPDAMASHSYILFEPNINLYLIGTLLTAIIASYLEAKSIIMKS